MKFTKTSKLAIAAIAFAGILLVQKASAQYYHPGARPVVVNNTNGYDSEGFRFGFGIEPGIPTGDLRDFSHFALGSTLRLQYDLKGPASIMLTTGYTNFFARSYYAGNGVVVQPQDYGIVPLKAGVKYFVAPHFYISGEAGAGFETTRGYYNNYYEGTKLILSPGIGIAESHTGLDLGLRYENYSGSDSGNFGMVALRIAYGIGY